MSTEPKETFDQFALVELFGHQRIVGRVTEATLAGGAFLRVDVPAFSENKAFTRFYGPSAIYSISPVEESIAMELVKTCRNAPVSRFDLPQLADVQCHCNAPAGTAECEYNEDSDEKNEY